MTKNYVVSEEVLVGLLRYLMSRPMSEVEGAVVALRNLPRFEPTDSDKEKESP